VSDASGIARISLLVGKVKEDRVQTIIDKLTVMTSGKEDVRDIASLGRSPIRPVPEDEADAYTLFSCITWCPTALKTVVQEISPDSKLANTACTKLAPKILVQLKNVSTM
jgi:cullin-associated NEDD8-dissociated protein 1